MKHTQRPAVTNNQVGTMITFHSRMLLQRFIFIMNTICATLPHNPWIQSMYGAPLYLHKLGLEIHRSIQQNSLSHEWVQ